VKIQHRVKSGFKPFGGFCMHCARHINFNIFMSCPIKKQRSQIMRLFLMSWGLKWIINLSVISFVKSKLVYCTALQILALISATRI
jgi:hypothetical protein